MPPLVAPPVPDDDVPPVDEPPVEDPLMDDVLPVPVDPLPVASPPLPAAKARLLDAASAAASINVLIFMILSVVYWTKREAASGENQRLRQQSSLRNVSSSLLWAGTAICARRCVPIRL